MRYERNKYSIAIFAIYSILLVWLILFKFSINIEEIDHMRNINIIPFQGLLSGGIRLKEIVYNIVVFIPMGIYIKIIQQNWAIHKIVTICFGISLTFEILQYIFAIGASDITDLIGNTLGGFIGIIFYLGIKRIFKSRAVTIINVAGTVIMSLLLLLLVVLMLANT